MGAVPPERRRPGGRGAEGSCGGSSSSRRTKSRWTPRAVRSARLPLMTDAIRTPDELLAELPDFPFEPSFREYDGLRLAHIDVGEGPPVVFFHGEPTWSFLWRNVLPPVRDAGFRCVAPDLPGFGRSDKPVEIDWYTYDRHTASAAALLEEPDLRDATAVVHDWGGPIGLRLAVEPPARIAR